MYNKLALVFYSILYSLSGMAEFNYDLTQHLCCRSIGNRIRGTLFLVQFTDCDQPVQRCLVAGKRNSFEGCEGVNHSVM